MLIFRRSDFTNEDMWDSLLDLADVDIELCEGETADIAIHVKYDSIIMVED